MAAGVPIVFALVYLAMLLGEVPGLALDRTGAALLGAIVLVATELVSPQQAWSAIDTPTLCLLFGPDQPAAHDVPIGWREHARVGVPVTVLTLALAVLWLWLRGLW